MGRVSQPCPRPGPPFLGIREAGPCCARGSSAQGLILMAVYCLGLGVPFLLLSPAVDRGVGLVRALGRRRRSSILTCHLDPQEGAGSASFNGDAKAEKPRRYVTQEVRGDDRDVRSRALRRAGGLRRR